MTARSLQSHSEKVNFLWSIAELLRERPLEEIEADIREVEQEILAMLGQVTAAAPDALKGS